MEENEEEIPGLTQENLDEIQQCVDEFLTNKTFDENKADQLINDILEKVMEILISFKKPYKYITDLMLSHRVGAFMTNTTSASYDKSLDNIYYIFYPKEKEWQNACNTLFGKPDFKVFLEQQFGIDLTLNP